MVLRALKRNDPCRCGSGEKYKRCCSKDDEAAIAQIYAQMKEGEILQRKREKIFGKVRSIVNFDFKDQKFVAVGSALHWNPEWKTFIDFLYDYLKLAMGIDWWKEQFRMPEEKRSPVCHWAVKMKEHEKTASVKQGELFYIEPNGAMHAYLSLAYDLYVLKDNLKLQTEVVRRLKRNEHFPGARYELLVAATCIRAGFEIKYEDETDNTRRHPEFIAKHKTTGIEFDVEAKKRNRQVKFGIEDFNNGKAKLGVRNLLADAINKFRGKPFIVFLDLDMPPMVGNPYTQAWWSELKDVVFDAGGRDEKSGKDPVNMIVYTNYPIDFHEKSTPSLVHIESISLVPQIPVFSQKPLEDICQSIEQFGRLPSNFDA